MSIHGKEPAFPVPMVDNGNGFNSVEYGGLTKREWFAGQALKGMAGELVKDGYPKKECFLEGYPEGELIAQTAFMLADRMIEESEK